MLKPRPLAMLDLAEPIPAFQEPKWLSNHREGLCESIQVAKILAGPRVLKPRPAVSPVQFRLTRWTTISTARSLVTYGLNYDLPYISGMQLK